MARVFGEGFLSVYTSQKMTYIASFFQADLLSFKFYASQNSEFFFSVSKMGWFLLIVLQIGEGSSVYASAIANKLIDVVNRQYAAIPPTHSY